MKIFFNVDKNTRNNSLEYSRILEKILPNREILRKQNIKEYQDWVLEKERLLSEMASRDDGFKFFIRPYRHPIAKKFYEEIKPLAAFLEMQKLFKNTAIVQLSSSGAGYDAQICNDSGAVFYIEITVIFKDEQDVLGDAILNKRGFHVLGAKIEKVNSNTLACDDLSAQFSFNSILDETTQRIKKVIEKKNKINYPEKTLLIVGGICNGQYDEEDVKRIQDVLEETNSNKFTGTFFVDLNKKVFCYKNYTK